jgi:hypothetical protein
VGLNKTDFLEDKIVNHVLRNTAYTQPTTVYVGLFTVMPADDGTGGTEVSGGSYARQSVTFGAPSPSGQTNNSSTITFPTATADWATGANRVVGFGIFDASSAGNLLYYGLLEGTEYPCLGLAATDFVNAPGGPPFANNDQVVLQNITGLTGLTAGTLYYVVGTSGTTF